MYIITINTLNNEQSSSEITACNERAVLILARILEKQKIQFKVSDRTGVLEQGRLLLSGYKFWLKDSDKFQPEFAA